MPFRKEVLVKRAILHLKSEMLSDVKKVIVITAQKADEIFYCAIIIFCFTYSVLYSRLTLASMTSEPIAHGASLSFTISYL